MRKTIKNKIFSLLFLTAIVLFTACSPKSEKATFEKNDDFMAVEMVFTYEGDKVTHQKTTNVMPYSSLGVTTADEAKEILDPIAVEYQGYDGLTETIDYQKEQLIEVIKVDYKVADIEAIRAIPGMDYEGDTTNGISFKRSKKMIEDQGFTEVK